ncbi:PREDICTED: 15-hydroxyprostaglandin dehydrogenase [NAD(+)]-like [Amphimedon queenslandica]|uniref:15-hydroxyprostaglandin dehydrogenase [NAD(+)] n=1 Tax=Amphimedon queenslandica TaxID=400682 RepID=A0A1X7TLV5_AMPQE|nr:PREDICTED: 15-hydroxyprostaglandin dehydrogenase [NAD(+)]-like [Amphimedon queenslandica]|eukprot:XP_003390268.1 PREDICTED: 15-hydroxyprostaglandin dehydrogenase [NAD(+)]-like [Amphimedon queenslandica]
MSTLDLSGRVALVTGGAQGIGLAIVQLLLEAGAKVALVDISPNLRETGQRLGRSFKPENVLCLTCDVTDSTSLRKSFEKVLSHYGSLDIVVNNAGIADEVNWDKMLHINLHAVIAGTYLALELMDPEKGGVIINVSSMSALYPVVYAPAYSASKKAVVTFTRCIKSAAEGANVRVNCICPYYVKTQMSQRGLDAMPEQFKNEILQNGLMDPEDAAKGIMELITDTSKNGTVLRASAKRGLSYHIFNDNTF